MGRYSHNTDQDALQRSIDGLARALGYNSFEDLTMTVMKKNVHAAAGSQFVNALTLGVYGEILTKPQGRNRDFDSTTPRP